MTVQTPNRVLKASRGPSSRNQVDTETGSTLGPECPMWGLLDDCQKDGVYFLSTYYVLVPVLHTSRT